jgi:hypothetical protein
MLQLLIDEEVGRLAGLPLGPRVVPIPIILLGPPKTLALDLIGVKLPNPLIVKLNPSPILLPDIRIVMASLSRPDVDHHPLEGVLPERQGLAHLVLLGELGEV